MTPGVYIVLAIAIPLVGGTLLPLFDKRPNIREGITLVTAVLLFADVLMLVPEVMEGGRPWALGGEMLSGIPIVFVVEPLGMLFGLIGSGLWILNSIYSIGYMRGNNEANQTRFYVCFAVALASTMGVAFAGNLLTLFIFYEALTLCTYPLVTHKGNEDARRAGRVYLGILISTSICFQLLAIIWTWYATGTLSFEPGGILAGKVEGPMLGILLALYIFGIGKAAIMPIHRWLPAAMVAPTPVSALLHAVAVVKAGVFSVMKVVIYVFGVDYLGASGQNGWLIYLAAASLLIASLVAMTKNNLKARLAYSTVSQLAYVTLGAALANSWSVIGGSMHIAMHAMGKITLFFCAGAIYTAVHKTEISDMRGLGWKMPFTFGAFLIGALSIIGLPPLGGSWSKWYLLLGAAEADELMIIAALMISSLLNVAYLIPIVAAGFFCPLQGQEGPTGEGAGLSEAPLFCLVPLCLTAFGCLVLFFYADPLYELLAPLGGR